MAKNERQRINVNTISVSIENLSPDIIIGFSKLICKI